MIKKSRSLIVCMCTLFIGGTAYVTCSILSHDDKASPCTCMLCAINRPPQDGDYLYNHYLFVLSLVWIALMVLLGCVVRERAEGNNRKTYKKRNR